MKRASPVFLVLAVAAILAATGVSQAWVTNPANGHQYTLTPPGHFLQTRAAAVAMGGQLATIRHAGEQNFLVSAFGSQGLLWIGLTDEVQEGVFVWDSGEPVTYTNWASGQPDNAGNAEDYTHLWDNYSFAWNDLYENTNTFPGIVERGVVLQAPVLAPIGSSISYSLTMPSGVPYVFDVSTTGTAPGVTINPGNIHVPLNPPYLNLDYGAAIPPGVFVNFIGFSNGSGGATTLVNVPNVPQLIGVNLSAVFGYLDPVAPSGIGGVSNPVTTLIAGPAPIINTVVPASGVQNGGTSIQIAGGNFQAGASVKMGGTPATGVVVTATLITCTTPPGAVGPASVEVTNPDTLSTTLAGGFTYVATLVLSSVSPAAAGTGAAITVSGSGIQIGATVTVGGIPASVQSSTPTSLTFTNPPNIPCSTTINVLNPDTQTASIAFNPTPTISSIFGNSGPAAGGGSFVIFGSQFLPGTTVTVGGAAAGINSQSSGTLFCVAPPGIPGPASIVVSSLGGCSASGTYTYQ